MIDREHPLSVACQAKLLYIRRGAVCYRPRDTSDARLALRHMLLREVICVGRRHLGTLMQRMGI